MKPQPEIVSIDIPSTSDERVAYSPMRHSYRPLSDDEKALMTAFKDLGAEFLAQCDHCGHSRELSIARTKMEEAVMWACKHVTA